MPLEVYLFHESHDICALNKGQPPVVAAITTICPWREGVKEIEVEMEEVEKVKVGDVDKGELDDLTVYVEVGLQREGDKGDVWQRGCLAAGREERRQVMAPVLASNNKKKTD